MNLVLQYESPTRGTHLLLMAQELLLLESVPAEAIAHLQAGKGGERDDRKRGTGEHGCVRSRVVRDVVTCLSDFSESVKTLCCGVDA